MIEIDTYFLNNEFINEGNELRALYEDIYLGNSSELKKVDDLFDKLILITDKEKGLLGNKSEADRIIKEITTIINKMFNIDMRLKINYFRTLKPVNVAYTYYMSDFFAVFKKNVKEIMISKKTGYQLIKIRKIKVFFENATFRYFKYPELSNKKKEFPKNLKPITGRALTSILLHELGHNVFMYFRFNNDKGTGRYTFQLKDKPKIIVYKDKFKDHKKMLLYVFILLYLTLPSFILKNIVLNVISAEINNLNYMRVEQNANTLPFQYGYGKEIFENTIRIKWIQDGLSFFDMKSVLKALNLEHRSYQSIITRDVIDMINEEKKNTNNDPEAKEYLDSLKKEFLKDIKLIQTDMGIRTKNKID